MSDYHATSRLSKEKAPAGETGAKNGRSGSGVSGDGDLPSNSLLSCYVVGGFAVRASSFNLQGSPCCFSCATM